MVQAQQHHIGVAIEIPEPYGSQLVAVRRQVGDPQAERVPAHITLLPPTLVEDSSVEAVCEHLESAAASLEPFTMILRGTGTFRPISEVVFVAIAAGIAECEQLETRVRRGILTQELRFNYHPHVTIAHDLPDYTLADAFASLENFVAQFRDDKLDIYTYND